MSGRLLDVDRLGRRGYAEVHAYQERLVEERVADRIRDTLVLVEHDPVITIGRGGGAPPVSGGVPVLQVGHSGLAEARRLLDARNGRKK